MASPVETFDGTETNKTPTDPQSRDWIEVVTVVLLGVATIAIAWAAYQSSLWGGVQDSDLTESVLASNEALDAYQAADGILAFDKQLFIEMILIAPDLDTDEEFDAFFDGPGGFLMANMSVEGQGLTEAWFKNNLDLPWDDPQDLDDRYYNDARVLSEISEDLFDNAGFANENADDYVLSSTILAAVLFLVGISTVLRSSKIRWSILIGSAILFVSSAVYMLTLPDALSV